MIAADGTARAVPPARIGVAAGGMDAAMHAAPATFALAMMGSGVAPTVRYTDATVFTRIVCIANEILGEHVYRCHDGDSDDGKEAGADKESFRSQSDRCRGRRSKAGVCRVSFAVGEVACLVVAVHLLLASCEDEAPDVLSADARINHNDDLASLVHVGIHDADGNAVVLLAHAGTHNTEA